MQITGEYSQVRRRHTEMLRNRLTSTVAANASHSEMLVIKLRLSLNHWMVDPLYAIEPSRA